MNTKTKIIDVALNMFNAEGLEKVTTRHIAEQLNISQGNLHYHYPNKEEIILVLVSRFISDIKSIERNDPQLLLNREEVLLSMQENFKIMHDYRFIFKDNELAWRRVPESRKQIIELLDSKKNQIAQLIQFYKQQGIFRKEITQKQVDFLAEQFLFTISSWLSAKEYLPKQKNEPLYFARYLFRHWLPYLNDSEMKEWESIL